MNEIKRFDRAGQGSITLTCSGPDKFCKECLKEENAAIFKLARARLAYSDRCAARRALRQKFMRAGGNE